MNKRKVLDEVPIDYLIKLKIHLNLILVLNEFSYSLLFLRLGNIPLWLILTSPQKRHLHHLK